MTDAERFTTGKFVANDHVTLFTRSWQPEVFPPKALVFIIHGLAEHCSSYEPTLAKPLNDAGIWLFAHDHRGHGQSEGKRAYIGSVEMLADDVLDDIKHFFALSINAHLQQIPLFLFGHSMGGTVACVALLKEPSRFTGVILDSAYLSPPDALNRWYHRATMRVCGPILGWIPINALDTDCLTRDSQQKIIVENDPLNHHGSIPLDTLYKMDCARRMVIKRASEITCPLFVGHGTDDKLACCRTVQEFSNNVSSQQKCIKIYEKARHSLLKELKEVREDYVNSIIEWILKAADSARV